MLELFEAVAPFLTAGQEASTDVDVLPPAQSEPAPSTKPTPLEIENTCKLKMWAECEDLKTRITQLGRVQNSFFRAQLEFPTITSSLSLPISSKGRSKKR